MEFVTLPDHINCSFRGTNSPVLFRLEGGNSECGFRIEEYRPTLDGPTPFVTVYGDAPMARQQLKATLTLLEGFMNDNHELGRRQWVQFSGYDQWFALEIRPTGNIGFRVVGYADAITMERDVGGYSPTNMYKQVIGRIRDIFAGFYNV